MKRTRLSAALALALLGYAGITHADTLYLDGGDTVSGLGPGDTVIYTDDSSPSYTIAADGSHVPVDGTPTTDPVPAPAPIGTPTDVARTDVPMSVTMFDGTVMDLSRYSEADRATAIRLIGSMKASFENVDATASETARNLLEGGALASASAPAGVPAGNDACDATCQQREMENRAMMGTANLQTGLVTPYNWSFPTNY